MPCPLEASNDRACCTQLANQRRALLLLSSRPECPPPFRCSVLERGVAQCRDPGLMSACLDRRCGHAGALALAYTCQRYCIHNITMATSVPSCTPASSFRFANCGQCWLRSLCYSRVCPRPFAQLPKNHRRNPSTSTPPTPNSYSKFPASAPRPRKKSSKCASPTAPSKVSMICWPSAE
jgi:hypothetical protein